MRVTIVGLGLIGGSIAKALRRPAAVAGGPWHVTAFARRREPLLLALQEGAVDAVATDLADGLAGAELIVLAADATANLALLDEVAAVLGRASSVTVTDVSSTKSAIGARARLHPGLNFVGGHPMSGRERTGYAAAEAALFAERPWVVVPGDGAGAADLARVEALVRACGARPVHLTAEQHDAAVAAISHLPLIAAAALVEAVTAADEWPRARALAAQGWRDMSRLARGDPAMGAALLATNRAAVAAQLRRYRAELDRWLADLDGADEQALAERLRSARAALEAGE